MHCPLLRQLSTGNYALSAEIFSLFVILEKEINHVGWQCKRIEPDRQDWSCRVCLQGLLIIHVAAQALVNRKEQTSHNQTYIYISYFPLLAAEWYKVTSRLFKSEHFRAVILSILEKFVVLELICNLLFHTCHMLNFQDSHISHHMDGECQVFTYKSIQNCYFSDTSQSCFYLLYFIYFLLVMSMFRCVRFLLLISEYFSFSAQPLDGDVLPHNSLSGKWNQASVCL